MLLVNALQYWQIVTVCRTVEILCSIRILSTDIGKLTQTPLVLLKPLG